MCFRPIAIKNPNTNKVLLVPCGKCLECRKAYQNEWIFRLSQEMKGVAIPCFVTLTYNDENLPLGDVGDMPQSVLLKSDVQLFLKRLRKNGGELMKGLKYFAVGEYGSRTNRCHYHLVLMARNVRYVSQVQKLVEKCWSKGFISVKFCTDKQVHYVCKYMNKLDRRPHLVKPFRLYSRGLGLGYLTANVIKYYLTSFDRTCPNGKFRIALPRYFRRKLDELSEDNYYMKRAGIHYTDMLEEVVPIPNSRYGLFRSFQQRLQRLADIQTYNETHWDSQIPLYGLNQSWNSLFQQMIDSVPELVELDRNQKRILADVCIRNKLDELTDISSYEKTLDELKV